MTGKTTRKVDEAVQILFTEGIIYVPLGQRLKEFEQYQRGKVPETIICDGDAFEYGSPPQRDLFERILRRLETEHVRADFSVDKQRQIVKLVPKQKM